MAKTTKTNTGALDVSAMFQAGSAGTTTAKSQQATKGPGGFLKQVGQFALGYYMKSVDNLKAARKEEGQIFASIDLAALDADEIAVDITGLKKQLTDSNKVLNSPKWMLRPNSDEYVKAEGERNEAITSLANLSKQYQAFSPQYDAQVQLSNGTFVTNAGTKDEQQVGWSLGNSALEIYNSSLLVSGKIKNALSVDLSTGDLMVQFSFKKGLDGPFKGKDGAMSWDDPLTEEIESSPGKVKLSSLNFATADNPNLPNWSSGYIQDFTTAGKQGDIMSDFEMNSYKNTLADKFDERGGMSKKELLNFLFKKNQWTNNDGSTASIVEAMIGGVHGGKYYGTGIWTNMPGINDLQLDSEGKLTSGVLKGLSLYDHINRHDIPGTDIDESIITEEEMIGIQELIKHNINSGEFSSERLVEMIHSKATEQYDIAKATHDKENPKGNGSSEAKRTMRKNKDKLISVGLNNDETFTMGGHKWNRTAAGENKYWYFDADGITKIHSTLSAILSKYSSYYAPTVQDEYSFFK